MCGAFVRSVAWKIGFGFSVCAGALLVTAYGEATGSMTKGTRSAAAADATRYRDLYVFCNQYPSCDDGGRPSGAVLLGPTGVIYGDLSFGGEGAHCTPNKLGQKDPCGAVFALTPVGSRYAVSLLYSFCN